VASKTPGHYASEALTRFATAMAAKGQVTPLEAIVSMWTVCSVQLRQSGYSASDMADLLVVFQKSYRVKSTDA
jgi:hypothetical protein